MKTTEDIPQILAWQKQITEAISSKKSTGRKIVWGKVASV
jgi:hypothetical protein